MVANDVIFIAINNPYRPRAPVWEISVAEDEGIQADVQSTRSRTSYTNTRTSTASTISGLSTGSGSGSLLQGGSLQDMRMRGSISKESGKRKSSSACSLRGQSSESRVAVLVASGDRAVSHSLTLRIIWISTCTYDAEAAGRHLKASRKMCTSNVNFLSNYVEKY